MAKSREGVLQNQFRKALEGRGCYTEKVHGGIYSSGLPDLVVAIPPVWNSAGDCAIPGVVALVECKVIRWPLPTVEEVFLTLRAGSAKGPSRQRAVGLALARTMVPAFVLAFIEPRRHNVPAAQVITMRDIVLYPGTVPQSLDDDLAEGFLSHARYAALSTSLDGHASAAANERNTAAAAHRVLGHDA